MITNEFIQEGLQKEALSVARLLLRTRFPQDAARLDLRVEPLSVSRLEALCVALLNMSRVDELEEWLANPGEAES